MRLGAVVLDSGDARALAEFYKNLLGWTEYFDDGEYVYLSDGTKGVRTVNLPGRRTENSSSRCCISISIRTIWKRTWSVR